MKKRSISILAAMILAFLFSGSPLTAIVYGAQEKVTENFERLGRAWGNYPNERNLPDVVVTYQDGTCTVKNLPYYTHPRYEGTESYWYEETGNAGVFLVGVDSVYAEEMPYPSPSYFIVDTNKSPVTVKLIRDEIKMDRKILNNGITAVLSYREKITLIKPDGTEWTELRPNMPKGHDVVLFGIDYSSKTKQYAVMYGQFPETGHYDIFYTRKKAGVALFDEKGALVKQFLLKDLYYDPWLSSWSNGIRATYNDFRFSGNPDVIYSNALMTKKDAENFDLQADGWGWAGSTSYNYYKINLREESYTRVSKITKERPEFPFKVQYNQTGTYMYSKNGDTYTTLAALASNYRVASYSLNLDGTIQVVFIPQYPTSDDQP